MLRSQQRKGAPFPPLFRLTARSKILTYSTVFHTYSSELSIGDVLHLLIGISKGLLHLHSHNVVHRDIAARNILLGESGTPLVADFGLSVSLHAKQAVAAESATAAAAVSPASSSAASTPSAPPNTPATQAGASSSQSSKSTEIGGALMYRVTASSELLPLRWLSPESLNGVFTTRSDVWSFGGELRSPFRS